MPEAKEPKLITTAEAVAKVELINGTPTFEGVPIPSFALNVGDKRLARWINAQGHAQYMMAMPPSSAAVQQLARTMFYDEENYPD